MELEYTKRVLGTPYFQTENSLIYNGDCLEFMRKVEFCYVDLTITSPPYNIGKEYEEALPLDEYISWCKTWMAEIYRLTKPNGSFWLNVGYLSIPGKAKALPISWLLLDKTDFFLVQEIIWNYGAGVAGKRFFSPRNEKILWYVKDSKNYTFNLDKIRDPNVKYPNQKKNGKLRCNPLGKNPTDVWRIPKVTSGENRSSKERTTHPAQFPEAMIDRIIKASSNEGNLVMDPFLGSGTSAIVALKNNRKFIGFETSKGYCEITKERIMDYLETKNQMELFN